MVFGSPEYTLRDELESLVSSGGTPRSVREDIAASWERSVLAGLRPDHFEVPYVSDVDEDGRLLWAATPIIDRVAEDLEGSGIGLLLTDEHGHVITRRVSERGVIRLFDRIELAPGFYYGEEHIGTNAIGTAVAQRRPTVVTGAEHFADSLVRMACAASPITDRTGRIVGVLDLSCTADRFSPLMLPLAKRTAWEIEQRLRLGDARMPGPGWWSLTRSERTVAELVAEGLTNREVAANMLVSRHTIDSQLRQIFDQLGVHSRVELARVSGLAVSQAQILKAVDETRRGIERDLHDGLQQQLVSLGMRIRLAEMSIPPDKPEVKDELARVVEGLKDILENVREISRGIHPAILSEAGLVPALKALARRSPIPVKLDLQVSDRLPEPVEVSAYYVASEALANTAKHANATQIEISLVLRDGVVDLSVRDDGTGGADRGGSGLSGLAARVGAVGGSLSLVSPTGGGTLIRVEIPVP